MKLLAGRTQDLADVEAVVGSGADRHLLVQTVQRAAPGRLEMLQRVFDNVDRTR